MMRGTSESALPEELARDLILATYETKQTSLVECP